MDYKRHIQLKQNVKSSLSRCAKGSDHDDQTFCFFFRNRGESVSTISTCPSSEKMSQVVQGSFLKEMMRNHELMSELYWNNAERSEKTHHLVRPLLLKLIITMVFMPNS